MVFFVQPPQAQASPPAPLPKERVAQGGDVPNPTYMLSFVSNYIQYVSLLYHVFKAYVIEKYVFVIMSKPYVIIPSCSYVTLSSKPMFLCITQKPHPVSLG